MTDPQKVQDNIPKRWAWPSAVAGLSAVATAVIFRKQIAHFSRFVVDHLSLAGGIIAAAGAFALSFVEKKGQTPPNDTLRIAVLASIFVGAILAVLGSQIDSSKLLRKQEELATLAQRNLDWVTGGDGFVDLQPTFWLDMPGTVSFGIVNLGNLPAYEVTIKLTDVDARANFVQSHIRDNRFAASVEEFDAASIRVISRSIMFPHTAAMRLATYSIAGTDRRNFSADIFARNGHATCVYKLAVVEGRWMIAKRVEKEIAGQKQEPIETIPQGFPLSPSGKVDW